MHLSNNNIKVNIKEITDVSSCQFDTVYDFKDYSKSENKEMLLIEIDAGFSQRKILLYCDFVGNYEYCTVLYDKYLTIAKFNTVYMIDVFTGEIKHKNFPDMAGASRLYLLNDGYLLLGECEIVKLDFSLATQWSFSAEDIFVSSNGENGCKVYSDRVELVDFNGNRYTIPLTTEFVRQVQEKEEKYCSYVEITENPIVLDFAACGGWRGIHPMLKKKFGLPDYYGENWDALRDSLHGLFDDILVEIHNFYSLETEIQEYCKPMLKIFDDIHKETPGFVFKIVS